MNKHESFNELNKATRGHMLDSYKNADEIIKGGEGSRGGKVIGHTQSGKPVYKTHTSETHQDFTSKDYQDASTLHLIEQGKAYDRKDFTSQQHHMKQDMLHSSFAKQARGVERIEKELKEEQDKAAEKEKNKAIGATKSGKAIHNNFDHEDHKDFTAEDHAEASDTHDQLAGKHAEDVIASKDHTERSEHADKVKFHLEQSHKHFQKKKELEDSKEDKKLEAVRPSYNQANHYYEGKSSNGNHRVSIKVKDEFKSQYHPSLHAEHHSEYTGEEMDEMYGNSWHKHKK